MDSKPDDYEEIKKIHNDNRKWARKDTHLHEAAKFGAKEYIRRWCASNLLVHNAESELMATNEYKQTVFHVAFWCGEHYIVDLLLQWIIEVCILYFIYIIPYIPVCLHYIVLQFKK